MTTTVRKGTSRAAATARRTKAAQKPTATPTDNLDSMSLGELRQLAVAQGWSTVTKGTKASIIKTLRDNPDGPPAVAQANTEQPDTPKTGTSREGMKQHVTRRMTAQEKAEATAKVLGGGEVRKAKGLTTLAVNRKGIKILLAWDARGAYQYHETTAISDGKSRKVRNVSEAIRLVAAAS